MFIAVVFMNNQFFLLWNVHILLESLPVSSSGHVRLLKFVLSKVTKHNPITLTEHTDFMMHIPTVLVLAFFIGTNGLPCILSWLSAVIIADGITGWAYLFSKKKRVVGVPLSVGFAVSACALLSVVFIRYSTLTSEIGVLQAIAIGIAQSLSLVPGVSRLALTCVTGMWLGIAPEATFVFSLCCELALALVALIKTAYDFAYEPLAVRAEYKKLFSPALLQGIILLATTIASYMLLGLACSSFANKKIVYFGFYLAVLSVFTAYLTKKNKNFDI